MEFQLRFCIRLLIMLAVLCPLVITGGGCGGGEKAPLSWTTPGHYSVKIVEMTILPTVRQGESPSFSVTLQMTKKMAALLPENGYASLVPFGGREIPGHPGQGLLFSASVYYTRSSDKTKNVEIGAVFPGFFRPRVSDDYPFSVSDPFAKNLVPGRYNVFAHAPTDLPQNRIEFFGSFEVVADE